ncbi:YfhO family protein [Desemzia sp. RIT804]|uniref:YfhO family protein n=1 Tax=Desemzia sp. RIT 804 TaxID=2810209 RepID=UPI00194E874E|nr:YfhO family protein [Desemzia sp. RIT 804]MBM6614266.1 YfhO family protein [Desemzia sp. RIT 804]
MFINNKEKKYFILSFILPMISLLITYFLLEIFPFGTNSLLTIDLNDQYLSFFSYFKNLLNGDANLFYSFSKGMGGEMIGLSAYYLLSPFNLILFFANVDALPTFVLIITLLKVSSAGLSMYFLLKQTNTNSIAVVLSYCYALMGYNIVYQQNIMWLDGVILLPLVISGIEKILNNKNFFTYTIFLSIAIITNYYIGFMLCIFSAIYFFIRYFEVFRMKKVMLKDTLKLFLNFIYGSLLAGGLSACITIPTLYSFEGGSAGFDVDRLDFVINFSLTDFVTKFYIGSYDFEQLKGGYPNIYTSLFVSVLVVLFFLSKKIHRRNKITSGILIMVLISSFLISGIDLFWHGLNVPNWYPYRYSFIFSFVLIQTASKALNALSEDAGKNNYVKSLIIIAFFLWISFFISKKDYGHLNDTEIIMSVLFVAVYCVLLVLFDKSKHQTVFFFIVGIIFCEMSLNSYLSLKEIDYNSHEIYQNFVDINEPIFTQLTKEDQFYRIEKTYHYSQNDPLLFNYNGLSHYSTTSKENEKNLLGKMGYDNQKIWAMYSEGSSIPTDSFFGVKYILTDNRELDYYKLNSIQNGISIYENPYILPLGFAVSDEVYEFVEYKNPIDYQNKLFQQTSLSKNIFDQITDSNIEIKLENVDFKMVRDLYRFGKINPEEKGTINFYMKNHDKKLINFYFDIIHYDDANIYVDDQFIGKDFNKFSHTVNIAQSNKDEVKITIELLTEQLRYYDAYFYYQDNKIFIQSIDELNENPLDIKKIKNSSITGEVIGTNEKSVLLLTIPYDESWKVKINGEHAETKPAFEALLSVDIPEGKNNIELNYKPKGLLIGFIISVVSLSICIIKNKKNY